MRTTAIILLILFFPLNISMGSVSTNVWENFKVYQLQEQSESVIKSAKMRIKAEYKAFTDALAEAESSNNYYAINGSYFGKYQFGPKALQDIGMSLEEYKASYHSQEKAMLLYLRTNYMYLEDIIQETRGKEINGITMTVSGMLAAAHLAGHSNLRQYIYSDGLYIFKDGNGTSIERYLIEFGGYKLWLFKQTMPTSQDNWLVGL